MDLLYLQFSSALTLSDLTSLAYVHYVSCNKHVNSFQPNAGQEIRIYDQKNTNFLRTHRQIYNSIGNEVESNYYDTTII